jgi:hypothetical protein
MNWEYKTIKLGATGFFMGGNLDEVELDTLMNQLGMQGWELATSLDTSQAYGRTKDVLVIFKRPRG